MLPEGWRVISLGEACDGNLQTGPFGSQLHAHEYVDSGVPVLMPKDLINYRASLNGAAKITQSKAKQLKKHELLHGDLIFSRRGDVARFALIDSVSEGSLCGTGCLKARPSNRHSSNFLFYFLQKNAVKKWLEQNAVGQTMPNMNTEILSQLPLLSASSLKEEEKIAEILSTWDKAITTTEKLLKNSQQQKKALMQQLLTGKKRLLDDNGVRFTGEWQEHELNSLGDTYTGLSGKSKKDFGKGKPYIPYINIFKNSKVDLDKLDYVNIEPNENQSVAKYGDIFFTTSSEVPQEVGMSSVLLDEAKEHYLNSFCFGFRLKGFEILRPQFAQYLLRSEAIRRSITKLAQGATRYNLSKKQLLKIQIKVPCVSEQIAISEVLTSIDREFSLLQQKLDYLKQEKKALMQQLLTGKRRVKVN